MQPLSQSGVAVSESSSACGVERDTSPKSLDPLCMCRSTVRELAEAETITCLYVAFMEHVKDAELPSSLE